MEIGIEHQSTKKRRTGQLAGAWKSLDYVGVYPLALFFLLGTLFGTLVGAFSDTVGVYGMLERFLNPGALDIGFVGILWNTAWYHLLALFLASSMLGFALLPLLSALRGYLLAVTAASIVASVPDSGVMLTLVYLGLPALLSIPCFFVLATDAFALSRRLLGMISGSHRLSANSRLMRHITVCGAALLASAAIEVYICPQLARLII